MLTKDLLRFRNLSGYARPVFADPEDSSHLAFASKLLNLFQGSAGEVRSEILENANAFVKQEKDLKFSKGLLKILDDRCEYTGNGNEDYPAMRKRLFERASAMISAVSDDTLPEDFRTKVFQAMEGSVPQEIYGNIYADLPDFERLLSVPPYTPQELIEKYNVILAQSMVLYASDLELVIREPDGAKMRRLFKYLRFFRLLADVVKTAQWNGKDAEACPGEVHLKIDGPASILENGSRYGLQLASFLPALFNLAEWKVACDLKIGERKLKFRLDEKANLAPRYGRFGIYVPEEVRMFGTLFRKKYPEWQLSTDSPFLRGRGQAFLFPDMKFTRGNNVRYLELFHKWHARQLPGRLDMLEKELNPPLLIGINRSLIQHNEELRRRVEEHPLFKKNIFLFRDFPETDKVVKLLENSCGSDLPDAIAKSQVLPTGNTAKIENIL